MVHDPTHMFFKLPRPVDHPVEATEPLLPILYVRFVTLMSFFRTNPSFRYKYRVASAGVFDSLDPKGENIRSCSFSARILSGCIAYLRNVIHVNIFCDLCMDPIQGQWFHCVYCPRDLCEHCEEVDEHDTTHFSMVAKAPVRPHSKGIDPYWVLTHFYRWT